MLFNETVKKLSKICDLNVVYDIGAHAGLWSRQARNILPKAQFFLFEGNERKKNPNKAIYTWFNVVLSDAVTKVNWYGANGTGDSYYKENTSTYSKNKPRQVDTTTLDIVVEQNDLPLPKVIKLDTQGSELDILRGAQASLKEAVVIQCEVSLIDYNKDSPTLQQYMDFFDQLGYVCVGIDHEHYFNGCLAQLDMVFVEQSVKNQLFKNRNAYAGDSLT